MWMMGYNDGGDSFTGRKVRTIVPRPATVINPSCLGRIHGTHDLLSFNHHLAGFSEQSKRDFSRQEVVVNSRWNPTPEQLQTLEELYRRGTRTPSAEEIQHITAQLRRYGKIEGKNVFYWFQNHKARERQKRRRQLESSTSDEPPPPAAHNYNVLENTQRNKESAGVNVTGIEVERTKNWHSSTNCSTTLAEKTVSIQRTTAKAAIPERRAADHGWVHFDEEEAELQQRKSLDQERNATWEMMQFSCSSSSSSPTNNFIINSTTSSPATTTTIPLTSSRKLMNPRQVIKNHEGGLNIFTTPYREDFHSHLVGASSNIIVHEAISNPHGGESQTLQLFPLRSYDEDVNHDVAEKERDGSLEEMNTASMSTHNYKFFEFLPLKN
ncbi:hypothetical protein ACH5RR_024895 [Cinchona calisaya]|uniref:Homeobox domain-containing protein n=1 Tax=Cinchona calisaya TaxID=153742 RepID=A0ABD2Z339_9GENT